jgi:hypothetical protein
LKIKRLFIRRPNGRLMTDTTHVVECLDDYSFRYLLIFIFWGTFYLRESLSIHFERNERKRASIIHFHARLLLTFMLDGYIFLYLCHFLSFSTEICGRTSAALCWPSSLTHWRPTRRAGTYCCRPGRKWAVYDGLIHLHVYLTYYYYTFLFRIIYMFPCWPTWHRRRDSTTHSPVSSLNVMCWRSNDRTHDRSRLTHTHTPPGLFLCARASTVCEYIFHIFTTDNLPCRFPCLRSGFFFLTDR